MKKLLALTLAMLFLGAGIASADLTITGDYYAQGTYAYNNGGEGNETDGNDPQFGWYDQEMNIVTTWQIDKATQVVASFEVRDETWASAANSTEAAAPTDNDADVYNELLYGSHTFAGKHTVRVGLVHTGAWGTVFGNETVEAYRVQLTEMTPFGALILFTQKGQGNSEKATDKDDDTDTYFAGLLTKVGNISIQPDIAYTDVESGNCEKYGVTVALMGAFNNVGWEAEVIWSKTDFESTADDDITTYGAYVNAWAQLNALKIGGLVAYGSYDDDVITNSALAQAYDDGTFNFGDDFEAAGHAMLLGDDIQMGGANDLEAVTLYALYADYAVNEKLTVSGFFGYADSNIDNPASNYDGSNAWEFNVKGAYTITDNLTYSVGAAMAEFEFGGAYAGVDPDEAYEVSHKLAFSF